jgi:glycosyltransferase involved in cell wall biosynthesis
MEKKYIRVLHAPATVGGNSHTLSEALKLLGFGSKSSTLSQNYLQYPVDIVVWDKNDNFFTREIKRAKTLHSVLNHFDVIHFNFGTTLAFPNTYACLSELRKGIKFFFMKSFGAVYTNIFQLIELYLLRKKNKAVFVTYQGDDARQGDYCLKNFEISIATQVDHSYYNKKSDNFKRRQIKRLANYADQIYSLNPDLLHVLPPTAKFIPYSHIFLDDWIPQYTQLENRPLRILHAPSHRKVKGTDYLLEALGNLKKQGFNFDLLLVEGLSNSEARKMYEKADILVDQLFAGWYGGLAVELMALGKPVIVYIRDEDLKFIPSEMKEDLPFIRATPFDIKEVLKQVIKMPREELFTLAQRSRAFVEKWHDPLKIAMQIKVDYEVALAKRAQKIGVN